MKVDLPFTLMAATAVRTGFNSMLMASQRALKSFKYTASHEFIHMQADGNVAIGITSFASKRLGRAVYIDLPSVGDMVGPNEILATVESLRSSADVTPPGFCEVIEVNEGLSYNSQDLNRLAEEDVWILKAKIKGGNLDQLMDLDEYESFCRLQGL